MPSLEDIDIIYEQTPDDAPMRELAIICLAANMSSGTASILYEANATFVRDFAVYGAIHGTVSSQATSYLRIAVALHRFPSSISYRDDKVSNLLHVSFQVPFRLSCEMPTE